MLSHRSVDRMGVINLPVGMERLHKMWGVKENNQEEKSPGDRGDVVDRICLEGTVRAPEGNFLNPYKGRPATVVFLSCFWVVPGDVPSCRWARCCCRSQTR